MSKYVDNLVEDLQRLSTWKIEEKPFVTISLDDKLAAAKELFLFDKATDSGLFLPPKDESICSYNYPALTFKATISLKEDKYYLFTYFHSIDDSGCGVYFSGVDALVKAQSIKDKFLRLILEHHPYTPNREDLEKISQTCGGYCDYY